MSENSVEPPDDKDWICARCGTHIDAQSPDCWRCSAVEFYGFADSQPACSADEAAQSFWWRFSLTPSGCVIGGFMGLVTLTALGENWGLPWIMQGAFIGGPAGAVIGMVLGWRIGQIFDQKRRVQFSLKQLLLFTFAAGLWLLLVVRVMLPFLRRVLD